MEPSWNGSAGWTPQLLRRRKKTSGENGNGSEIAEDLPLRGRTNVKYQDVTLSGRIALFE
jgi:hypothetical protein